MHKFTRVNIVPQMSAHNLSIIVIPSTVTHCPLYTIYGDLHPASTFNRWASTVHRSPSQPQHPICTRLDSCGDEKMYITTV